VQSLPWRADHFFVSFCCRSARHFSFRSLSAGLYSLRSLPLRAVFFLLLFVAALQTDRSFTLLGRYFSPVRSLSPGARSVLFFCCCRSADCSVSPVRSLRARRKFFFLGCACRGFLLFPVWSFTRVENRFLGVHAESSRFLSARTVFLCAARSTAGVRMQIFIIFLSGHFQQLCANLNFSFFPLLFLVL
jgi:hypothetical protein